MVWRKHVFVKKVYQIDKWNVYLAFSTFLVEIITIAVDCMKCPHFSLRVVTSIKTILLGRFATPLLLTILAFNCFYQAKNVIFSGSHPFFGVIYKFIYRCIGCIQSIYSYTVVEILIFFWYFSENTIIARCVVYKILNKKN